MHNAPKEKTGNGTVTFAVHSFTVISRKIIASLKSEIFPPLWESISVGMRLVIGIRSVNHSAICFG